jgi:GNAT superfamily N-acetyltransferase
VNLCIRPLTMELWPTLEDLFGKQGACNGCWCMYWRIGREYQRRPRKMNKAAFRKIVEEGPPPGLVAFDGGLAVGWCQLTPRRSLRWLDDGARLVNRVDDEPVWSLSCFYVRRSHRGRGIMAALIEASKQMSEQRRAPALEAYPVDKQQPKSSGNLFTGVASTFARAGFKEVARRAPDRPIMPFKCRREGRSNC